MPIVRTPPTSSFRAVYYLLACLFLMVPLGCGGSDDTPSSTTSPSPSPTVTPTPAGKAVFMNFQWAARTRNIGVDASRVSSALSAVVRFYPNDGQNTAPIEVRLNRDPAQPQSYSDRIETGTNTNGILIYRIEASLYSGANQSGAVVGTTSFLTTVDTATGEMNNSIAVNSVVRGVTLAVPPVGVGRTVDVVVTATDAAGKAVPVTPGSISLAVRSGQDKIAVINGVSTEPFRVQGLNAGSATLTATIDDIAGDAAVTVIP
ncbi:MAG: hypothetical protein H7145_10650 [Akkermansiaceae bacterium]|nr:hypothetical protein [Armatimonadota bacterium]